jgi:nitrite reductase/ring-hydroxylating ferredoxin subunit
LPSFFKVARVSDIAAGAMREVSAGDRKILLANLEGQIFAIDGECLHQGGPLAEGQISGDLVECPWHFWQWNLKTGECAHDPAVKTRCYEVKVEGEDILVAV